LSVFKAAVVIGVYLSPILQPVFYYSQSQLTLSPQYLLGEKKKLTCEAIGRGELSRNLDTILLCQGLLMNSSHNKTQAEELVKDKHQ
jgi:hypothetical protein